MHFFKIILLLSAAATSSVHLHPSVHDATGTSGRTRPSSQGHRGCSRSRHNIFRRTPLHRGLPSQFYESTTGNFPWRPRATTCSPFCTFPNKRFPLISNYMDPTQRDKIAFFVALEQISGFPHADGRSCKIQRAFRFFLK